jgi:hypothetical protein
MLKLITKIRKLQTKKFNNIDTSMKTSKAALLMKGGDYLQQLKVERDGLVDQATALKRRIEALNLEVGEMLAMMPSGGYPWPMLKNFLRCCFL